MLNLVHRSAEVEVRGPAIETYDIRRVHADIVKKRSKCETPWMRDICSRGKGKNQCLHARGKTGFLNRSKLLQQMLLLCRADFLHDRCKVPRKFPQGQEVGGSG